MKKQVVYPMEMINRLCGHRLLCAVVVPLLAAGCLLGALFCSAPVYAQQPGEQSQSQRFVTIDFNDVDINLFIKYISELTGKNFIVDRTVKGKVTIISPTRISEEDAYRVFESVLEVHGFTTVCLLYTSDAADE